MKKYFYIILISFLFEGVCYAITNEKLYRLKYNAKTDITKNMIQKYCAKEDPGLEIDSDVADIINFSNSCKCAINAGNEIKISAAKKILNSCNLSF